MTPATRTPEATRPEALLALARAVGDTEAAAVMGVVLNPPRRRIGFCRTEAPVAPEALVSAMAAVEYRLAITMMALRATPAEA